MTQQIRELVHREVSQAMRDAAHADKLSVDVEGMALAGGADLLVVIAPISGVDKMDLSPLLSGQPALKESPVMYWYLGGPALTDRAVPLQEGYYTVLADQIKDRVLLRDAEGEIVAAGGLDITFVALKISFNFPGGKAEITDLKVDQKKKEFKVCGSVSVGALGGEVKVEGCIEVSW